MIHCRNLLIVMAVGLVINTLVAGLVTSPGPSLDATYYYTGAVLITEQGWPFAEPYFWNYLNPPPEIPYSAFGYWQPLPSFIAAVGLNIGPRSFGAAQVPYVLLASLLPALAYLTYLQVDSRTDNHKRALIAGLLICFAGYYAVNWVIPETFTPFAVFGGTSLYLVTQGATDRNRRWWVWLLAGVCAGLAYLTRSDGLLLVLVGLGVALWQLRLGRLQSMFLSVAAIISGYLIVAAPWLLRNLALYGSIQPPGGISTIFLLEYNDLFRYPPVTTPARFIDAGLVFIIRSRVSVLVTNLQSFVAVNNYIFLTPFTVIALFKRWRQVTVVPSLLYAAGLFTAMTFIFAYPGQRGGWFHSSAALMPFLLSLAVLGLEDALRWAGQRVNGWRLRQSWQIFAPASIVFAAGLTIFLTARSLSGWNTNQRLYESLDTLLSENAVPADAVLMSNNAPAVYLYTGRSSIPLITGGEEEILRAAVAYQATYLLLPFGLSTSADSDPDPNCFEKLATVEAGAATLYQIICQPK